MAFQPISCQLSQQLNFDLVILTFEHLVGPVQFDRGCIFVFVVVSISLNFDRQHVANNLWSFHMRSRDLNISTVESCHREMLQWNPWIFWRCKANQPHMTPTNRFVPPSECSAMADLPTCASPNSFEEILKLRCKVYWKSVARSTKVPWLLIQHVLPFIWHWTSLFVCN